MNPTTLFEADRAAVINLPHITALKIEHEQQMAVSMDQLTTSLLQEVFKLGFEAGFNSKKDLA